MARVCLNRLTADAYAQCFQSVFETVKKDHPQIAVGTSLQGIVLDWSDHQMKGQEAAVASRVAKGCRVHFQHSVKRVSEQVNKNQPCADKAFTTIAYTLFQTKVHKKTYTLCLMFWREKLALKQHFPCVNSSTVCLLTTPKPNHLETLFSLGKRVERRQTPR